MAFIGPSEDKMAIRELYGCYADASMRGDLEEWLACWAEDCRWDSHVFNRSGKADLREQWNALWVNFDKVAFLGEVTAIEIDGPEAIGRSATQETIRLTNGGVYKLVGRYEDRLVRVNGKWLFSRRDYHVVAEDLPK